MKTLLIVMAGLNTLSFVFLLSQNLIAAFNAGIAIMCALGAIDESKRPTP